MQRVIMAVIVLFSLAVAGLAQQQQGTQTQPRQQQPPPAQQGPPQQPGTAPGAPGATAPGDTAAPGQAPGQPPAETRRIPAAKTQEELTAYQAVVTKMNPAEAEPALTDFIAKYPDSELKPLAYEHVATLYFGNNQNDKALELARKTLEMNPESVRSLLAVATVLADTTRETDLDKEERLAEAQRHAAKAAQVVESGNFPFPAGTPPEQAEQAKKMMLNMAYAALGNIETVRKNYAKSEEFYQKAVDTAPQPDPVLYLRLSVVQDYQGKYAVSLKNATKAVELAPAGSQVASYAARQRERAQKLAANPPKAGATNSPQSTTIEPK